MIFPLIKLSLKIKYFNYRKTDYRNVASLLDDKSDVQAVKESYKKFEITVTERSDNYEDSDQYIYDDEYNDTYDDTTTTAWADAPTPGDDVVLGRYETNLSIHIILVFSLPI